MRAMAVASPGGPESLRLVEMPTPTRVGHEVLVRVVAAGVNPVDAKSRAGAGVSPGSDWPMVPGYDFSGVVVQTPYEAFPLSPGDEVFGMTAFPRTGGSYAEYVSVPAFSVARKPSVLSHAEAAAVPLAALTAWGAVVDLAKAHEGQKVLIHAGAGGVGHLAVQIAAYFGAEVVTTASPKNAEWLLELGASRVIDYTTTEFEDELADLDVVIDGVGNAKHSTGSRSLQVLRPGGLIVSLPSAGWPTMIEDAAAAGMRATHYFVQPDAGTLSVIARLITSGDVRVTADTVLPLEEAERAHILMESGHVRGKIALKVSDY
ncbi:NADP-dependent oxidoreductase [Naasia lichenicola]|uniref:NADP-dependent oxidoreductase n=1 Tax=Naasia lichenicola TaxID=2565933 RepID=A0A4S4FNP5_9MICO|nr:NADP-dependent oxidoreductase [Naasia lichenicola]THG31125.1 NADP-dependent oxidoreductase [Naasia lichenicola]